jgi:FKBP-type peptidyl-prolyl cis-trans isomerase SlyD
MSIEKNTVVAFTYILNNDAGDEVERSQAGDPMVYLHGGYRNLLPRLEDALAGKAKGEELSVTLAPEYAYGMRKENAIQRIPIKHLINKSKRYKAGMVVQVSTKEGPRDVVITKVGKFNVDVDTNHPLAGLTVTFNIVVQDIRDATADEISHGHCHGWDPSGHHH